LIKAAEHQLVVIPHPLKISTARLCNQLDNAKSKWSFVGKISAREFVRVEGVRPFLSTPAPPPALLRFLLRFGGFLAGFDLSAQNVLGANVYKSILRFRAMARKVGKWLKVIF